MVTFSDLPWRGRRLVLFPYAFRPVQTSRKSLYISLYLTVSSCQPVTLGKGMEDQVEFVLAVLDTYKTNP